MPAHFRASCKILRLNVNFNLSYVSMSSQKKKLQKEGKKEERVSYGKGIRRANLHTEVWQRGNSVLNLRLGELEHALIAVRILG